MENLRARSKTKSTATIFRVTSVAMGLMLVCAGSWILGAELFRNPPHSFPLTADAAVDLAGGRSNASLAANIGALRGELWIEYSATYLNAIWPTQENLKRDPTALQAARYAALHGVALAPHDSRAWLILAATDRSSGPPQGRFLEELQMSYFTGTNEVSLIPLRVELGLTSSAVFDPEYHNLLRHDIRNLVMLKKVLPSAVKRLYRSTPKVGKQLIEEVVQNADPELLDSIRGAQ